MKAIQRSNHGRRKMKESQFINIFLNYIDNAWDISSYESIDNNSIKLLKSIPKKFDILMKKHNLEQHISDTNDEDICLNLILDIMRTEEGFYTDDIIEAEIADLITEMIYANFKELYFYVKNGNLFVKEEEV